MWVLSGNPANLEIEFRVGQDFVIPESVNVTLLDSSGTTLVTFPVTVSEAVTIISIPGAHNTLQTGSDLTVRMVDVMFVYKGIEHHISKSYMVTPRLPITVTPDTVRQVLGLDRSELPDEAISIWHSYLDLRQSYGQAFADALLQGGVRMLAANRAVAIKAALMVLDSLPYRAATTLTGDESRFQRNPGIDLTTLRIVLGRQLGAQLSVALQRSVDTVTTLTTGTPTDAITGA